MRRPAALLLALLVAGLTSEDARASTALQLCGPTDDPCIVTGTVSIGAGSILDFGARALDLRPGASLTVSGGSMTILAGSVRLESHAALIGSSAGGAGASILIQTSGNVAVETGGNGDARIDVSAGDVVGSVEIDAGGAITVGGQIDANGNASATDGGTLMLNAGGAVTLGGASPLSARGGTIALGGAITVLAGGSISISGAVRADGGDGGDIDIESASGDITCSGTVNASADGTVGDGGDATVIAARNVTVGGAVMTFGQGTATAGSGDGGDVDLEATAGSLGIPGSIDAHGSSPDGGGGEVDLFAGTNLSQSGTIDDSGNGGGGCGGAVSASAGGSVTFSGTITGDGGFCGADVEADGAAITVGSTAHVIADAGTEPGSVTLNALQALTIAGRVTAQSTTTNGNGGAVQGAGCTLSIPDGASIRTDGTSGLNLLQASGQMTIGGQLLSRPGHNRLEYLDPAEPPIILGTADIRPTRDCAPAPGCLNPNLPVCAISSTCGNGVRETGEGCDDGNTAACDGCSPRCQLEGCGNGVIECGEQCDDGPFNGGPGEPCDATCHTVAGSMIFVPSGHRGLGCMLEWAIRAHPVSGFPPTSISCTDGDPRCDTDGFIDGGCTFELSACLNLADVRIPSCRPTTVLSVNVRRPSITDPVDAVEAANAQALVDAVEQLGLTVRSRSTYLQVGRPVTGANRCTAAVAIRVPHAPGAFGRRLLSAGAENSDSHDVSDRVTLTCAPNAAVCGNSIVQLGEECDDGNRTDCDGCSSRCHFERCGNGIVDCGEQCDDGASNGTPGDPCSALCSETPPATRIPGGNGARECAAEFSLAAGHVLTNSRGIPSPKQICVDGDPTCDFDPTPGTCRFHVWTCLGGADARLGCVAGTVSAFELLRPDGSEPAPFGAAHDVLLTALARISLPAGPGEVCSQRIDLDVPAGRTKLLVKTDATTATGRHDRDALRLVCAPEGTQLPSR